MDLPGALRVVSHEGQRFLCFCGGAGSSGCPRLQVTNASEVWCCDVPLDKLDRYLSQSDVASPEDGTSKLREILGCQMPTLAFRNSKATLQFQEGRQSLSLDLHKAPISEARKQLQDLMFSLVAQVHTLEKRLEECAAAAPSPLSSPEKNPLRSQSLFAPDISPPKYQGGTRGGRTVAKRRLPGESLINPGFKSKKTPTGVDFEDL